MTTVHRRAWLKSSGFALAGLGLAPSLLAFNKKTKFDSAKAILLNSNENAYGSSPLVYEAMSRNLHNSNRYPDNYIPVLKKKIAQHWNVAEENILLGAGSSEIIALACMHISKMKGHIITGEPSYKVWNNQAASCGLSFNTIPLTEERKLDVGKMFAGIKNDTRMIYVCNPNNPTATACSEIKIADHAIEASKKTFVLIDEAYSEFAELQSLATMAAQLKNFIVAKTFSKIYGLAGARVGYAIAHPETIQTLSNYQPWPDANISVVTAAAAAAALEDQAFVKDCREKINNTKDLCYATFNKLSLEYIRSRTNFILFNIDKIKSDFIQEMQSRNIYVQFRNHFGGKWCRVTVGTADEMQTFLHALEDIAV